MGCRGNLGIFLGEKGQVLVFNHCINRLIMTKNEVTWCPKNILLIRVTYT